MFDPMSTKPAPRCPEPPYYAAILSTRRTSEDPEGYAEMGARMVQAAESQPGYLGRESLDGPGGHELAVVYYATEEAILQWREHAEHLVAHIGPFGGRPGWPCRSVCRRTRSKDGRQQI
jgi:heme-degrading monooxygenase HmoA